MRLPKNKRDGWCHRLKYVASAAAGSGAGQRQSRQWLLAARKIPKVWILVSLSILLAACTKYYAPPAQVPPGLKSQKPYQINGIWYYPLPSAQGYVEDGLASWYGPRFDGKPTSCGEPYNMWADTAAHKTLPLGTYVKVTNLENGRSTILRINDRGPFVSGRIIDLSAKGAQDLGCHTKGLAKVRVEAVQSATAQVVGDATYWKVDPVPSFRYGRFTIQIGAFRDQANAYRLKGKMTGENRESRVTNLPERDGLWYRVQVGSYQDLVVAKAELERFRSNGFPDAFVIAFEGAP
ncbi:MAG: septal ring lytic transglycosylase RlpA family protein [Syntrophobacteraceae bacterium]